MTDERNVEVNGSPDREAAFPRSTNANQANYQVKQSPRPKSRFGPECQVRAITFGQIVKWCDIKQPVIPYQQELRSWSLTEPLCCVDEFSRGFGHGSLTNHAPISRTLNSWITAPVAARSPTDNSPDTEAVRPSPGPFREAHFPDQPYSATTGLRLIPKVQQCMLIQKWRSPAEPGQATIVIEVEPGDRATRPPGLTRLMVTSRWIQNGAKVH